MDWRKFLSLRTGEEADYEPEDMEDIEAIITLSETIRPRLALVARHHDGSDVLLGITYDTEKLRTAA